jgi:hypothetical protein
MSRAKRKAAIEQFRTRPFSALVLLSLFRIRISRLEFTI